MRKEIIEIGKTVDSAIENACQKLGCPREDCEWEIIDLPKKGFLGIKNVPAKVRVSIEIPEQKLVVESVQRKVQVPDSKPLSHIPAAKQPVAKETTAKSSFIKDTAAKPQSPQRSRGTNTEPVVPNSEKEALAKDYIDSVLKAMDINAEIKIAYEEGGMCLNISGQGLGAIIGRRGETLDALQYLTSLVANRSGGDYMRITIDCGDYRVKRHQTLESLARKLSAQVLKTNTNKTLEPMNPFERRIIHATVSEIEGVSSISIGDEPNRRVVITSSTARQRNPRSSDSRDQRRPRGDFRGPRPEGARGPRHENDGERGERSFNRRDNRTPRQDRPAPVQQPAVPKQTPESRDSNDKPLYTKIDLE